jgi:hypothetical protein
MSSQNVLQLQQQTGSADTSSIFYAVKGGNTDTGLPLTVLFNTPHLTSPVLTTPSVTGGSYSGGTFSNAQIASPTIAGGSADNISIGGLTPGPGSFTTLSATGVVSGAGFTTLLAPYALKASPLSQFASTTSAQLSSIISDETGSGSLVFGTSPTIATPNIRGITSGGAAIAGQVGEVISGAFRNVAGGATSVIVNIGSISLTPGVWLITGHIESANTALASSLLNGWINTVSATLPSKPFYSVINSTTTNDLTVPIPPQVFTNTVTTTIFCSAATIYSSGTQTYNANVWAVRIV